MKKKILLTGATGYIGGRLIKPLLNKDYEIVCLARHPQNLQERYLDKISLVKGDVFDKEALSKALKDVDVAYYLIHSMGGKDQFEEKDRQAAEIFAKEAAKAKVKKIIYLGGLGDSKNNELSPHLKSRQEVGEILRKFSGATQVIEFRASIVIGSGSTSFEMIRALCERLPIMVTPKWVYTLLQPIAITDLISYLVQASELTFENHPIFEIGGKDRVTYAELMQEYSRQRGLKRYMINVPVLTPYLSSLWLGLVTPLYASVGRYLIESAIFPTVVTNDLAKKTFAIQPMGVKESIEKALLYEDVKMAETRWIDTFTYVDETTGQEGAKAGNRIIDVKSITIPVPVEEAFKPIERIGGSTGYYYGNWLWRIRGLIDLFVSGVGFRRGRRDPERLFQGDVVDFWRVEKIIPNERLLLRAEMKVAGRAWLEFTVDGYENISVIKQKAIYEPCGLFGLVYWYSLYPIHHFIFKNMLKGIAKKAIENSQKPISKELLNAELFFKKTLLEANAKEVFDWHNRKGAFERLSPPWQQIKIVQHDEPLQKGGKAILLLTKGPFKLKWELEHKEVHPGHFFNDVQLKGPLKFFEHNHIFEQINDKSSFLIDSLQYQLPGGKVIKWCCLPFVKRNLKKLFRFRHQIVQEDIKTLKASKGKPMKFLIAGSNGLVGQALIPFLTTQGHTVYTLVRKKTDKPNEILWNPKEGILDKNQIEGFDCIVNLAGENIAKKWNEQVKKDILDSRVESTNLLAKTIAELQNPPKVLINASAIGYYGNRGEAELNENSAPGTGFLSDVCKKWEDATKPAEQKGVRVVKLRTGMVLSSKGGALAQMLTPFKAGMGGKVGSGEQYVSWISIEDLIAIIVFLAERDDIKGPVNLVSPESVKNKEFTKKLGEVLNRPTIVPFPEFAAKMMFGEMAEEMLLSSTRVEPKVLEEKGYKFKYPTLKEALQQQL
ncbi:MAG: TIGR01777 family protein [Chlamydia sp. 32-24]|nr:MAG: TIGR01777 family protein [Chlamydia sp. 32-24]